MGLMWVMWWVAECFFARFSSISWAMTVVELLYFLSAGRHDTDDAVEDGADDGQTSSDDQKGKAEIEVISLGVLRLLAQNVGAEL